MSKYILSFLTILIMLFTPGTSYTLPPDQVACSPGEIQILGTGFNVLPISVVIPTLVTQGEQCKVTFSAEVATAEPNPQLLQLDYAFSFPGQPPPPFLCNPLDGTMLTKVEGGIDETHTFISVFEHARPFHGSLTITPCISSLFGGQFRLRRHCLTVECQTK